MANVGTAPSVSSSMNAAVSDASPIWPGLSRASQLSMRPLANVVGSDGRGHMSRHNYGDYDGPERTRRRSILTSWSVRRATRLPRKHRHAFVRHAGRP